MISKSDFIRLAEQSVSTIQKIDDLSNTISNAIGCHIFEKLYDTGAIQTIIDNLAAAVDDKEDWIDWILSKKYPFFPIVMEDWVEDDEPIKFNNWGDVYDFLKKEQREWEREGLY